MVEIKYDGEVYSYYHGGREFDFDGLMKIVSEASGEKFEVHSRDSKAFDHCCYVAEEIMKISRDKYVSKI